MYYEGPLKGPLRIFPRLIKGSRYGQIIQHRINEYKPSTGTYRLKCEKT